MPLRDQREMMERPFFSLAKSKRVKPIDYTSPDGKLWVHVSANPDYGMATIWDADILIYCASVLADMARRGANDIPRKLHVMPYDLLRAIGRPTTGRASSFGPGARPAGFDHDQDQHPRRKPPRSDVQLARRLDPACRRTHRTLARDDARTVELVLGRRDDERRRAVDRPRLFRHHRRTRTLALQSRAQACRGR
jgi:plasmid replication initiation protein